MWPFSRKEEVEKPEEEEPSPVGDAGSEEKPCIHMRVMFTCTCHEGDSKPVNCSTQLCPARAQAEMYALAKEQMGLKDYV